MSATEHDAGGGRSRFTYHGDEPEEGGVTSVQPKGQRQAGRPASPGVPGPEERLLDISELVRNIGMRYTHRIGIPPGDLPDLPTATPITGQVTLTNTGALLLLKGHVATSLSMDCYRCLNPTVEAVEVELEEAFPLVAANNAYHQTEVQAVDEDAPAAVISGNILDLGDLLRQELTVASPPQPLCREDCPGLLKPEEIEPEPEPTVEETPTDTRKSLEGLGALWAARQGDEPA
jgi:uncharacterized metal-binding protein YceD (DUF177 family)